MSRKKGPKPTLNDQAASLSELRAMAPSEMRRQTCGHCQVTYRSGKAARECETWHRTGS
jgi:hypothetical protein